MAQEFKFTVYSKRWGHDDNYRLSINADGWQISHIAIGGPCDKQGHPYLYANLDQDSIVHPSGLGLEMELLFEHARDKTLPDEEIQRRLDRLGQWVNDVDNVAKPSFDD